MDLFHAHCLRLCFIYWTFIKMVHTLFSTIEFFILDSGNEFILCFFASWYSCSTLVLPFMLRMVCVAEWKYHHLIETACTLLILSFVPSHFWGEAVSIVISSTGKPSSNLFGQCPSEVLFGTPLGWPNSLLSVFSGGNSCHWKFTLALELTPILEAILYCHLKQKLQRSFRDIFVIFIFVLFFLRFVFSPIDIMELF